MKRHSIFTFPLRMLGILACFATSNYAVRSDIYCLKSIKDSLEDGPRHVLSSWIFDNSTEGFVCKFDGVSCWHDQESRVIAISLRDMGLRGPFPTGIKDCTSIQHLDLSGNYLSGSVPSTLAIELPYIVSLDLSNNDLSGPVPPNFGNFSFINVLRLDNNQLTGEIPSQLSNLPRLHEFSIANNRLSGPIPILPYCNSSVESYANNIGLCGGPLSRCKNEDDEDHFFSGLAIGLPISTTLTTLLLLFGLPRPSMIHMRSYLSKIKKIKGLKHHLIPRRSQILIIQENITEESKITAMEKHVCRLSLMELEIATNDFDFKKLIGYGNMGLMYKAKFLNGLTLAVKRLHKFESFEKEFLLEIEILGRLRHTNLVPLLAFCFEMEKKFLVYKYMSNGTLYQWLHSRPQMEGKKMGWTLRLRIAIGIARGLAWLHHNNVLRVAHLKMNSNCILLDDNFEPKISNFGDSNILLNTSGTPSSDCNFVVPHSSPIPYKEDVYSFGLMLFELVSGRERRCEGFNSSCDDVCYWELFKMVDECLMGQGFDEEIYKTLRIAENCIQTHKDGATSMLQVYQAIRLVGKSRIENSVNLCMDVEDNEGNI